MRTTSITFTHDEIVNLIEGLDAYRYWQLTADNNLEYLRSDGDVRVDAIEDDRVRKVFEEIGALQSRLEAVRCELGV